MYYLETQGLFTIQGLFKALCKFKGFSILSFEPWLKNLALLLATYVSSIIHMSSTSVFPESILLLFPTLKIIELLR